MIGYIKGTVDSIFEDRVLVENNGIGYEIYVPGSDLSVMPHSGEEVKLYTYLHVREDLMQLFGFLTHDSLGLFKLLITVSGIGPKGALGILSTMDADTLRFAILANDSKAISRAPGIGKKTAEKLVLELRDKIDADSFISSEGASDAGMAVLSGNISAGMQADASKDAIEALVALGYSATDSARAVKSVLAALGDEPGDVEVILKHALKVI